MPQEKMNITIWSLIFSKHKAFQNNINNLSTPSRAFSLFLTKAKEKKRKKTFLCFVVKDRFAENFLQCTQKFDEILFSIR